MKNISAFNGLIMSTCFMKKPGLLTLFFLAPSICVQVETELCKKRVIYLSKGYHLIRIYLSQFCFKVVGGGGGISIKLFTYFINKSWY